MAVDWPRRAPTDVAVEAAIGKEVEPDVHIKVEPLGILMRVIYEAISQWISLTIWDLTIYQFDYLEYSN